MFPIDSETLDFDEAMTEKFDSRIADKKLPWKLRDIMPRVCCAGDFAGKLTEEGAKLLDPTGRLKPGIPFCPPEAMRVRAWWRRTVLLREPEMCPQALRFLPWSSSKSRSRKYIPR